MNQSPVLRGAEDISADVLQRDVARFAASSEQSSWSNQHPMVVTFADGTTHTLRLKVCLGATFGRSEVDYYTRDYLSLIEAPLVRCWNAEYEEGIGYHLLLDDLSATYRNRRGVPRSASEVIVGPRFAWTRWRVSNHESPDAGHPSRRTLTRAPRQRSSRRKAQTHQSLRER
jgi:hypothetical protein